MLVTFGERLGSILRFSDFEILDLEIFGWSFHIVIVDLPYTTTPESKYGYATSQATKKEQNLNMRRAPRAPPAPGRRQTASPRERAPPSARER